MCGNLIVSKGKFYVYLFCELNLRNLLYVIYKKVLSKYANPKLLILDEWLLLKPTEEQQRDIFELISARRKKSSTIFCSQFLKDNWYDQLGGDASALSDGIIDRIFYDSYVVNILPVDKDNDKSMREVYGMTYAESMMK